MRDARVPAAVDPPAEAGARVLEGLRHLLDLQRLDDELIAYEQEHARIPEQRKGFSESRAAREVGVAESREALTSAEAAQRQAEARLQDQEALLQRLESQQFQVKSNEAYTALLSEMDHARQAISDCETRILEAMEQIESARGALSRAEQEARANDARVDEEERALAEREELLVREIARLRAERDPLCQRIDPELLVRYSRVAARRRPAVVLVSGEMCTGCRMDIPPQSYIEILRGEGVVTCGHCQRVLIHLEGPRAPAG